MPEVDPRSGAHGHRSGPVGRATRVALGVLLLAGIAEFYLDGSGPFVLATVGVSVGLIVIYTLLRLALGGPPRRVGSWLGAALALVPVIVVFALGAGGGLIFGAGEGWLGALTFLGVSLVAAGLRGDAGCEVMALPNALAGTESHLACLVFSPLDRVERRWRDRTRAR